MYTAIHVIQGGVDELNGGLGDVNKGLGITGTTALEASTTLAGSFAAMQASLKNVLGALTLGQDLQPSLDALAQSVVTFLAGNLLPDIWNILSALPGALVTFIQALAQTLLDGFGTSFSGGFPQIIESGTALVSNLVQGNYRKRRADDGICVCITERIPCTDRGRSAADHHIRRADVTQPCAGVTCHVAFHHPQCGHRNCYPAASHCYPPA